MSTAAIEWGLIISLLILVVLLFASAMLSGSEIAYFSLSPDQLQDIKGLDNAESKRILKLKEKPQTLLATILIANNFINIAIVILSTYIIDNIFTGEVLIGWSNWLQQYVFGEFFTSATIVKSINLFLTVVLVTFLLVLIGEVTPKIYANYNNKLFARLMSKTLSFLVKALSPISGILVDWTNKLEKRVEKKRDSSNQHDLGMAIDLAVSEATDTPEEVNILKGIIKFNEVTVTQIMRSRVDIVSVDIEQDYFEILAIIKESGYSRIPVIQGDMDNIVGILYVKDLLNHIKEQKEFNWQRLVRKNIIYVPESKKISTLLNEFQQKRLHLAIVVDEYGGSSGLLTLEDIMEEIIGDIKDESDEDVEINYEKLDNNNYIFEGKTLLIFVCRLLGKDIDFFDEAKGEADTLAGLILEMVGQIPEIDKQIFYQNIKFTILATSNRRIEKIKLTVLTD